MNKERLLKLATHLRQEKLPIKWDFCSTLNRCGTAGCALGNLPFVWPEQFPLQKVADSNVWDLFNMVESWFGLDEDESDALFNNSCEKRVAMEFPHQSEDLSPLQVAENIEWFVEHAAKDEWWE